MNSNPFLSIIIATLNVREYLDDLIQSLNTQTFTNYEVLISDGGSNDGSIEYFNGNKIRNLAWFKSAPDKGIYYGLNEALAFVRGTWILVIGADDRFVDNNSLMDYYNSAQNVKESCRVIYSDLQIKSKNRIRQKIYPQYEDFKKIYKGCPPLHHQTVFIRPACLKLYGVFDVNFKIHADYEFFCRMMCFENPYKINQFVVLYNDAGFSSNLINVIKSIKEIVSIRRKYNCGKIGIKIFLPHLRSIFNKLKGQ